MPLTKVGQVPFPQQLCTVGEGEWQIFGKERRVTKILLSECYESSPRREQSPPTKSSDDDE